MSGRMRVLHCIYDDPANPWVAGGGAVRVWEIYRRLSERIDITVATGNYPGARDEEAHGIHYRRLGLARPYALSRLSYAAAATRLIRRGEYDVGIWDFSVYAPVPLPRWPAPVALIIYHLTGPTAPVRWGAEIGRAIAWLERALLRRAHWISTASDWTIEQVRPIVGPETRFMNVGAAVEDRLFRVDRSEADYLLYFGRLDLFQKGLDTLIDAMVRVAREWPEVELRIAGRGKDAERVAALVEERGLAGHVRLLGPVSEPVKLELMAGAQLLLMPSRFEGFGIVAVEAQAVGVPVVAAAAGSLPEVVSPEGGVLVPPEDADALATAVLELLADPARRRALGQGARRAARRYSWDAVANRHLEFLERVAADARGSNLAEGEQ